MKKLSLQVLLIWLFTIQCASQSTRFAQRRPSQSSSTFSDLCVAELGPQQKNSCLELNGLFFKPGFKEKTTLFKPEQINASNLNIDKKIHFVVFNDPNLFPAFSYCYFVFNGWINPSEINPNLFASASTSFSILDDNLVGYKKWLNQDPQGMSCRKLIETEMLENIFDLQVSLKGYIAFIGLNPYASMKNFGSNITAIKEDLKSALNHERILVYQSRCPEFAKWSQEQWRKTKDDTKKVYQEKYPHYNWNDPQIAAKEFIAYSYEKRIDQLNSQLSKCKL